MNRSKGSITIEAAISTIAMIAMILTFGNFMKVVHVHGVIQHALIQTAGEIAEYSYFYSLSGLSSVDQAVTEEGQAGSKAVSESIGEVENFWGYLGNGEIVGSNISDINPRDMISNLAKALSGEVYGAAKTTLVNNLISIPLMRSYLPNGADSFFKENNVVASNSGEIAGIDFSKSRYFENADGYDEIELVAVYSVKIVSPIPIIDKVTIVQSAKSRSFFSGTQGGGDSPQEIESVWDKGNFDRADAIVKQEKIPNNMPHNFYAIRDFENATGTASNYVTIDLNAQLYEKNPSKIKNALNKKLEDIKKFDKLSSGAVSLSVKEIKKVDFYVVIPKGITEDAYKQFKKELTKLGNEIQLSDGRKVPLNIIEKQVK